MMRIALAAVLLACPIAGVAGPIEDKALVCAGCHGLSGLPKDKSIPILWGQNAAYLYLQLRDFEKGERANDPMSPIAQRSHVLRCNPGGQVNEQVTGMCRGQFHLYEGE